MTPPDHRRKRPRDRGFGVLRGTAASVGRVRAWAEDAGDSLRYYGELRGHRKATRRQAPWQPEEDGFEVP